MRYHCLHIKTDFAEEWQRDLFDQQLFDLGVETMDGNDYYIQSEVLKENRQALTDFLSSSNVPFSMEECPDENWNAVWESENPIQELPLGVKIVPHCAFGAGHHETTSMMINALLSSDLSGKNVLDHGTGTGVLAIFAKRLGAKQVLAIDIDDKSVENAKENAALNNVEIEVKLGTQPEGTFDIILANIHRNILIENMPAYAKSLVAGGEIWFSGFYEEDVPVLKEAAEHEGLMVTDVLANGEWRLMKCRKAEH